MLAIVCPVSRDIFQRDSIGFNILIGYLSEMNDYFPEFVKILYHEDSVQDTAYSEILHRSKSLLFRFPSILIEIAVWIGSFSIHKDVRDTTNLLYAEDYDSMYTVRDSLENCITEDFSDPSELTEENLSVYLKDLCDECGGLGWLISAYTETIERGNNLLRCLNSYPGKYSGGIRITSCTIMIAKQEMKFLESLYITKSSNS
ncbi:MAG: hypothetical protein ABIJ34_07125 [archaeon]